MEEGNFDDGVDHDGDDENIDNVDVDDSEFSNNDDDSNLSLMNISKVASPHRFTPPQNQVQFFIVSSFKKFEIEIKF